MQRALLFALALAVAAPAEGRDLRAVARTFRGPGRVMLSIPFDVPGCYPSGSAMGTKGEVITFTRVGTKACGVPTCQANELCVDADGASVGTGESLSVTTPAKLVVGVNFCVTGTYKRATWLDGADRGLWSLNSGTTNAVQGYVRSATTRINLRTRDGATGFKDFSSAVSFVNNSAHVIAIGYNWSHAVTIAYDGAAQAVNGSGTGTGAAAVGATFYIGNLSATPLVGSVKNFSITRGACL